jgi:hypothetical protein
MMNHEFEADINLDHNIIQREPTAHQSIEQKDSFHKSPVSMV